MAAANPNQQQMILRLKKRRATKKASITRRINGIMELINNRGKRTKVTELLKFLLVVMQEAEDINQELADIDDDHDESWIEVERERCDTIRADVQDYIASRIDDPPSTASLTEEWVQQHAPGIDNTSSLDDDVPKETDIRSNLDIRDQYDEQSHHEEVKPATTVKHPMRPPQHHFNTGSMSAATPSYVPLYPSNSTQHMPSTSPSTKPKVYFVDPLKQPPSGGASSVKNEVDSWIDELDPMKPKKSAKMKDDAMSEHMMSFFVQQSLPRMEIPEFDGSASLYIEFMTKIKDLVHDQPFLSDVQRSTQLIQRLKGEAKQAVRSFSQDWFGYVSSLKKLKFLFGQRSAIARAVLLKVTRGKNVQDNDAVGLSNFYYSVSECITTLSKLNYASDLYSTDTLLQAVKRLPQRLINKWAEYGLMLRQRTEDPNLLHFESWLQSNVFAQREACVVESNTVSNQQKQRKSINVTVHGQVIVFWKTKAFKDLQPAERFEKVKELRRCYNCLGEGHITKSCPSKGHCLKKGCSKRHHTVLHEYFLSSSAKEKKNEDNVDDKVEESAEEEVNVTDKDDAAAKSSDWNGAIRGPSQVYLQVVPVVLSANNKMFKTYALLDSASMFTVLRDMVKKKLNLTGKKGTISYGTIKKDDEGSEPIPAEEVSLSVSSADGNTTFAIKSGYAVSQEHFNMPCQPNPPVTDPDGEPLSHIKDLGLKGVKASQISILIGADMAEATLAKEVRSGNPGEPLAINTMLGWTLYGTSADLTKALGQPVPRKINLIRQAIFIPDAVQSISNDQPTDDVQLNNSLERFWKQEQSLISPAKDTAMSQEDTKALQRLDSETRLVNGHYEVPMLWRYPDIHLPNNYIQAFKRFMLLVKRFHADPDLHIKYEEVVKQLIRKGYARRLTEEEVKDPSCRRWFLPHFPVTNPNKPGKVRVVNDAAAEFQGTGLNKNLVTGPDLLNSLTGVLTRFRRDPVAIAGDIEAMFHQVRVSDQDSDSLCFLWTDDIHSKHPPYILKMLAHIFGAKDSMTCCCYALQRTVRDHCHLMSALAYETILKSFYADDLLRSVATVEGGIKLVRELMEVLKLTGFRITKFVSNSKEVLDSIPAEDVSPKASIHLDGEGLERVLGAKWDISTDTFTFTYTFIDAPSSKRGILKVSNAPCLILLAS